MDQAHLLTGTTLIRLKEGLCFPNEDTILISLQTQNLANYQLTVIHLH